MSDTPPPAPPSVPPSTPPADAVPAGAGRVSARAITSLVLGVFGFCTVGVAGLAGVIVGVVSLSAIRKSNGALTGTGLAIAGIVVSAISMPTACLSGAVLLPALAKARVNAKEIKLRTQARVLVDAAMAHATESGGTLVLDDWENALVRDAYITPDLLQSPFDSGAGRCFAFNASVDGLTLGDLQSQPALVLLFECVPGSPLTGGPELLWQEKGPRAGPVRSVIVYADGTTEVVPLERYMALRWDP